MVKGARTGIISREKLPSELEILSGAKNKLGIPRIFPFGFSSLVCTLPQTLGIQQNPGI